MAYFPLQKRLTAAAAALAFFAVACGDDVVGPMSLSDPLATTAEMQAVGETFNTTVFESFSALGSDITPAPSAAATARALIRASQPILARSGLGPYSRSVEDAQVLLRLVPTMSAVAAQQIFPPEVLGKTFGWNGTSYVPTARAGADPNGVRFILYAIDRLTGLPSDPLTEVGYVDLIDESSGSTIALRIRVAGVGGTPVYVNYVVSVSATATSFRLAAEGSITNPANPADVLAFSGSFTVRATSTGGTVTQDVSFDIDSRGIHVRLIETLTVSQSGIVLEINFRFEHGDEVVTARGTITVELDSASGTITVRVNGGLFATCEITATPASETVTCVGADEDGLNADEQTALQAIADAIEQVSEAFSNLFAPAENVLGG